MNTSRPDLSATRTIFLDGVAVGLSLRRYILEVLRGPDQGLRRTFEQRAVTIGSSPDNQLCLADETISRRHCRIEVDELGYRLVDLGSKNGTTLGGFRIREAYLNEGASFTIGETELRWTPEEQEVEVRFSPSYRFGAMHGKSLAMREIFARLERVAPTDVTVLIEGESGTGKELVAQELHARSKRSSGPLIVFDCSAVPRELIESELFGHMKGSFTGAVANRQGAFEQARGGTLFLDELGELSLDLQPKLLRALESRTIRPVGGNKPIQTDLRIIAATNRNLAQEVEDGNFREDLYYRLAVIKVRLPPLRERPEDIPLLVRHFIQDLGGDPDRLKVSYETMEKLKAHTWQGNVRELRNFIERTMVLSTGESLSGQFLEAAPPTAGAGSAGPGLAVDITLPFKDAKSRLVENFEREYWERLLGATDQNISEAARRAGIHRKSAEYLVKKLGLRGGGG